MPPKCLRCGAELPEHSDPARDHSPYCRNCGTEVARQVDVDLSAMYSDLSRVDSLCRKHKFQIADATIDEMGNVLLDRPIQLLKKHHAMVIVMAEKDDPPEEECRYKIERPLATGGMGETFVATDLVTGQTVCVKRLRPGMRSEILIQEWRSLSRVDNRYVVRFLDQYEHRNLLHLVMEYIDGPTLAHQLRTELQAGEIMWLALGLMRGVQACHQLNIIHCDIKPQNILIHDEAPATPDEPGWVPKIIDFGLAVLDRRDAEGDLTAEGRMAGTPAYMAPEQVNGWVLGPACDLYAIGLILYEALARRRAFVGDVYSIVQAKKAQASGLRVGRLPPGTPRALGALVERCTHPHPAQRPTATEAIDCLEGCLMSSSQSWSWRRLRFW